ncbi:MAG: hypothetical protein R2851_03830 [Caldilineaceae bacterium]
MFRSFKSGQVESIDKVRTIADNRKRATLRRTRSGRAETVDEIVLIEDDAMRSPWPCSSAAKLAVEPRRRGRLRCSAPCATGCTASVSASSSAARTLI